MGRGRDDAGNTRITLFVAFNYGGRAEIVDAARTFTGGDEDEFRAHLYAPDMHDPDLIIRTSGEQRISNYLLWQSAYSELVFRDELWPDFIARGVRAEPRGVRRPASAASGAASDAAGKAAAWPNRGAARQLASDRRHRDERPRAPRARPHAADSGAQRSDLFSRILVAVPAAVVAIVFIDLGGTRVRAVHDRDRLRLPARALPDARALAAGRRSSASRRSPGWCWPRATAGRGRCCEVAVATVPVLFLVILARPQHGGATIAIAGTLLGVFWIGFAFAHAVLLRELPHGGAMHRSTCSSARSSATPPPTSAVACSAAGRSPRRSRRTRRSRACSAGCSIAVLSVFFAGLYQTWLTQGDALLLGVAVAVLGPLGDLFESLIKRDAGTKDAGTLFGAHGGALDRLDAVMFTIVAGYYVWVAVMH